MCFAGAIAESLQQSVGGFPTTKSPSCVGTESLLSECSMIPIMLSGQCMATKVLVRCYMSGADTSECGISTQPPSSVNTDSPTTVPFTSTSESTHHDGPTTSVQSPDTTSSDSTEHITSTQNPSSGTSQQNRSNLPTLPIIIAVPVVAVVVVAAVLFSIISVLCLVQHKKSKDIVRISHKGVHCKQIAESEADSVKEDDLYTEMTDGPMDLEHQNEAPLYETILTREYRPQPSRGSDNRNIEPQADEMELKENIAYAGFHSKQTEQAREENYESV